MACIIVNMFWTIVLLAAASGLSCLDATGAPQDYWVMLKAPEVANVPPLPGKSYMYMDSSGTSVNFMPKPLNDSSPMTYTLSQLNQNPAISFLAFK
jgi:hypothetical protein